MFMYGKDLNILDNSSKLRLYELEGLSFVKGNGIIHHNINNINDIKDIIKYKTEKTMA